MEALYLKDITQAVGGKLGGCGTSSVRVSGLSTDTRTLSPGDLYVALRGDRYDGHDFIDEAVRRGAAALMVAESALWALTGKDSEGKDPLPIVAVDDTQKAMLGLASWYRRRFDIPLVAITGSNGKTTTKDLLGTILTSEGETVFSERSFNNFVGVPLTLFKITPGSRFAVAEIGTNAPGEIRTLTEVADPLIGVVTNISPSHLAGLNSVEGIAREKGDLLRGTRRGGTAVINSDDPFCGKMRAAALDEGAAAKVVTFGLRRTADLMAREIEVDTRGISFTLGSTAVELPLLGVHNVYNALAAFACALELGLDREKIAAALKEFRGTPMRLEPSRVGSLFVVNDAYNANPASVAVAIKTFTDYPARGRKLIILGDMLELGKRTRELHRRTGARLAKAGFDLVVAVGDRAGDYVEGALRKGVESSTLQSYDSLGKALSSLPALVRKGDSILVKGSRGMGLERVVEKLVQMEKNSGRAEQPRHSTGTVT